MSISRRCWVDTISDLLCNVLEGILGCLPLKDAVKTSILSKHWRYKWITRQELDFCDSFFKSFKHDHEAKAIIYQVLLLHKGPILKLRLQTGPDLTSSDIDHWKLFLSKKNVQEFTLYIHPGSEYHLPSHFFTFQQLRHLKVRECFFHPPPDFKGFEKLIKIELEGVTIVPATLRNLISRCPLLEELRLLLCTDLDSIEIDAANLKCFAFCGKSNSICFKNAPILGKVCVYLDPPVETDAPPLCSNLSKFFHYMPSLMGLGLGGFALESLTAGGVPKNPPTALNSIKFLSISRVTFEKDVSCVVYLITNCPKLEALTVECVTLSNTVVEPVERAQLKSHGVVKSLRREHMHKFTGIMMEMEFVRFILSSAPLLEELFIFNSEDENGIHRRGKQLMVEMEQFHRASPNVEIKFRER